MPDAFVSCFNRSAAAGSPARSDVALLLTLLVLAVLAPLTASGQQNTAVLAGRVLDVANGAPIGFASVVVEDAASGKQLSGALTGDNGRFVVQGLPPGTYKVRISFVGYYPADADLLVSTLNQSYDLGDIRLPRLEGFEEKVTVTAEAIRAAGIDTQVFRLDEGPTQSTGTILVALKNVPGVTVDQEGKVSLRGSDQVAILINGRMVGRSRPGPGPRPVHQTACGSADRTRQLLEQREGHSEPQPELPDQERPELRTDTRRFR